MKPHTALALKARSMVTFQRTAVPQPWQHVHGEIVFKAVKSLGKKDVKAFGLHDPYYVASLLGLKRIDCLMGDFSFVKFE